MKNNRKGFTLAELLIVVAIIGVLVAVSIPIFTNQLKKARLATNQANARAAEAACVAKLIGDGYTTGTCYYYTSTGTLDDDGLYGPGEVTPNQITQSVNAWEINSTLKGVEKLDDGVADDWWVTLSEDGILLKLYLCRVNVVWL